MCVDRPAGLGTGQEPFRVRVRPLQVLGQPRYVAIGPAVQPSREHVAEKMSWDISGPLVWEGRRGRWGPGHVRRVKLRWVTPVGEATVSML